MESKAAILSFLFSFSPLSSPVFLFFSFSLSRPSTQSHSAKNPQLHVHEIIHDAPQGKAVIYASSRADTLFADGFEWTNEYAVFLSFSDNGERVVRNDEMVDTAFYHDFFPRFQAHLMKEKQQEQE